MLVKPYTNRQFHLLLKKNGYRFLRQNGDHRIYTNGHLQLSVPWNTELNKYLTNDLIKKYHLVRYKV